MSKKEYARLISASLLLLAIIIRGGFYFVHSEWLILFAVASLALMLASSTVPKEAGKIYEEGLADEEPSISEVENFGLPLILYLRPFRTDKKLVTETTDYGFYVRSTTEWAFTKYLDEIGSVVTLRNRTDNFIGAAKIDNTETDWQNTVRQYAEKSGFIVWHWGLRKSVIWELNELLHERFRHKLIIYFPVDEVSSETREYLWKLTFVGLYLLSDHADFLPFEIGNSKFITFSKNGEYEFVKPRGHLIWDIRNLVHALGYPTKRFSLRMMYAGVFAVMVLIAVALGIALLIESFPNVFPLLLVVFFASAFFL